MRLGGVERCDVRRRPAVVTLDQYTKSIVAGVTVFGLIVVANAVLEQFGIL